MVNIRNPFVTNNDTINFQGFIVNDFPTCLVIDNSMKMVNIL